MELSVTSIPFPTEGEDSSQLVSHILTQSPIISSELIKWRQHMLTGNLIPFEGNGSRLPSAFTRFEHFQGGGVGISHIFFGNRGNVQRNEGQIPAFHGDKKINSFIYPVGNIFKKTIIEPRLIAEEETQK